MFGAKRASACTSASLRFRCNFTNSGIRILSQSDARRRFEFPSLRVVVAGVWRSPSMSAFEHHPIGWDRLQGAQGRLSAFARSWLRADGRLREIDGSERSFAPAWQTDGFRSRVQGVPSTLVGCGKPSLSLAETRRRHDPSVFFFPYGIHAVATVGSWRGFERARQRRAAERSGTA